MSVVDIDCRLYLSIKVVCGWLFYVGCQMLTVVHSKDCRVLVIRLLVIRLLFIRLLVIRLLVIRLLVIRLLVIRLLVIRLLVIRLLVIGLLVIGLLVIRLLVMRLLVIRLLVIRLVVIRMVVIRLLVIDCPCRLSLSFPIVGAQLCSSPVFSIFWGRTAQNILWRPCAARKSDPEFPYNGTCSL